MNRRFPFLLLFIIIVYLLITFMNNEYTVIASSTNTYEKDIRSLNTFAQTTAYHLPEQGVVEWRHQNQQGWAFNYNIWDEDDGLVINNVTWKGIPVLYKGSLPVVRVKYKGRGRDIDDGCGPYTDEINDDWLFGNMVKYKFPDTDETSRVGHRVYGGDLLEIFVGAEIGGYLLHQSWYFHKSGWMAGALYSSGWSCKEDDWPNNQMDHSHHAYFRLDFDVETPSNNLELYFSYEDENTRSLEIDDEHFARWDPGKGQDQVGMIIHSTVSDKYVLTYMGREDPPTLADGPIASAPWWNFSYMDIAYRRYRKSEDDGWNWRAIEELGWDNNENLVNSDSVVWMIGHMFHEWVPENHPDRNDWHFVGPYIVPKW